VFLIPSIDLRGGQCVRLLRGDFAAETRYDVDPVQYLQRFQHLGARWLHIVDLDGAREGTLGNLATLERLAAQPGIRLQVGSAAVETPTTVMSWIKEFGAERCCLALDVRVDPQGVPRVQIRGWTQSTALSLWEALDAFVEVGVKDVLCTDIAQDGALEGPNLALYREALERFPQVAWQASGGVRDVRDLQALADTGVAAAISGKALLDGRINDTDLAVWLRTESESPNSRPSGAEPRTA
jgi:phosphoribosylformimino-5-aminoimidazole carboxamide ribotide isomerase